MTTIDSPGITKTLSAASASSSSSAAPNSESTSATSASTSAAVSSSQLLTSPTSYVPTGTGILDNAHEMTARKKASTSSAEPGSSAAKLGAAFAKMFKHPESSRREAGRQIKLQPGQGPLGKTFERAQPIANKEEIKGPQVLDWDPRGRKASVGDGVLPPGSLRPPPAELQAGGAVDARRGSSGSPSGYESSQSSSSYDGQEVDNMSEIDSIRRGSVASSSAISTSAESNTSLSEENGAAAAAERTEDTSTTASTSKSQLSTYSSSAASSSSIRFAPLPTSGRLKRANSITIGVAARSHLLQSQGAARQNYQSPYVYQQPVAPGFQQKSNGFAAAPLQPLQAGQRGTSPAAAQTSGGAMNGMYPGMARADDVIDVGELVSKGAIKAWKKMRGRSASRESSTSDSAGSASSASAEPGKGAEARTRPSASPRGERETSVASTTSAMLVDEPETIHEEEEHEMEPHGFKTPKRSASPTYGMTSLSKGSTAAHHKLQYQQQQQQDGTRTPQHHNPQQQHGALDSMAGEGAIPHLTRRLSTGAFLKDQSLRQIQETRRREFMGDSDEEELLLVEERRRPEESGDAHVVHLHHEKQHHEQQHVEPAEQRGWVSGLIPKGLTMFAAPGDKAATDEAQERGRSLHPNYQQGGALAGRVGSNNSVSPLSARRNTAADEDQAEFRRAVESLQVKEHAEAEDDEQEGEEHWKAAEDQDEEEDDEETKEAERLAEEAMQSHSAKATRAGGIEKLDRKRVAAI